MIALAHPSLFKKKSRRRYKRNPYDVVRLYQGCTLLARSGLINKAALKAEPRASHETTLNLFRADSCNARG